MNELFNRIIAWHEKNLPAGLPYEPLPQIGFLIEELGEVNKEFIKGDIDAAVGEITDLIVFSVNAVKLLGGDFDNKHFDFESANKTDKLPVIQKISDFINRVIQSIWTVTPDLQNYYDLILVCLRSIKSLGYSPELALLETIKKIESRRGAWDASIGKWVKEKNQSDVYIPDYSLARLS